MQFHTVFDFGAHQFDWRPAIFGAGLAAAGVILFLVRSRKAVAGTGLFDAATAVVVGILIITYWSGVHYSQYQRLIEERQSDHLRIITGRVEAFQRGGSNSPDEFTVGGRRFRIWSGVVSESFNRRIADGGPNLEGKVVQIECTDRGEIVRLAIADDR